MIDISVFSEKITLNWWWKVLDIVCWRTEMTKVSCWLSPPESVAWVDDFFYCLGGWQIDQLPGWCLPGRSRRWSSRDWHIWCMIFHWCGPWHHICIFIYLNSKVVEADVFFEGQEKNFLARGRESRPTQVVQSHSSVPGDGDCEDCDMWMMYIIHIYLIYRNDCDCGDVSIKTRSNRPVDYVEAEVSCITILQVLEH